MNDFNEITSAFTNSTDWLAVVQETRARMHRENPGGIDVAKIGAEAWRQLTPIQQARALPDLWVAYICRLHDEERYQQLDTAAADEAKTYLEPDDEHILVSSLAGVGKIGEDAQVDGVCASALNNVLSELDLLRHRLVMAKAKGDDGD